jgi:hypothetical protein
MVFNTIFNNISVISWRSVLLVEGNFVIKIKHISTEFVKDLLLKCAYFT